MEGIEIEQVMRDGLRDMSMTIRALNVDDEQREVVNELASDIDTLSEESNPEALAMGMMTTLMAALSSNNMPMLAKMALGRMLSELNIKLIEGMQSSGI